MPDGLNPGDKVIALAGAATTAAIVAGATAGSIAVWLIKHKVIASLGGLAGGALLGGLVGLIVGRLIFPATEGNVIIAKWGRSSLPLTMKGNIIASLVTALLICALITFIGKADFKEIAVPCVGISVVLGIILALLTSLI